MDDPRRMRLPGGYVRVVVQGRTTRRWLGDISIVVTRRSSARSGKGLARLENARSTPVNRAARICWLPIASTPPFTAEDRECRAAHVEGNRPASSRLPHGAADRLPGGGPGAGRVESGADVLWYTCSTEQDRKSFASGRDYPLWSVEDGSRSVASRARLRRPRSDAPAGAEPSLLGVSLWG
jgi:hypothetical protein